MGILWGWGKIGMMEGNLSNGVLLGDFGGCGSMIY
jgi:hypothetical protein